MILYSNIFIQRLKGWEFEKGAGRPVAPTFELLDVGA